LIRYCLKNGIFVKLFNAVHDVWHQPQESKMMRLLTVILALSFSVIFAKEKINPILLLQPIEKVVILT